MSVALPNCIFVIIGYNNTRLTRDCVESFLLYAPGVSVWLFDNASAPWLKPIAEQFGLPYLYSKTNLGFAGGANRAIQWILQEANPEALCLVNNDVLVSARLADSLPSQLSAFLEDQALAAMTPLLFVDAAFQRPENFGIHYYQSGLAFQNRTERPTKDVLLNGAFLFLKTTVCEQLLAEDGFVFRPEYFFNAEDVELSLRLVSRGFKLLVNPHLVVQHLGGQSSKDASARSFQLAWRNLLWTIIITRSRSQMARDALLVLAGQLVLLALSVLRGHPELIVRIAVETFHKRDRLASSRRQFRKRQVCDLSGVIRPGVF